MGLLKLGASARSQRTLGCTQGMREVGTRKSLKLTLMEFNILFPWRETGSEQAGLWKNLVL